MPALSPPAPLHLNQQPEPRVASPQGFVEPSSFGGLSAFEETVRARRSLEGMLTKHEHNMLNVEEEER